MADQHPPQNGSNDRLPTSAGTPRHRSPYGVPHARHITRKPPSSRRLWRYLLLVTLVLTAVWLLPQILERSNAPCGALAVRQTALTVRDPLSLGATRLLGDAILASAVSQKWPNVPPELACVGL